MSAPFRICRTHNGLEVVDFHSGMKGCGTPSSYRLSPECDIVSVVWSADGAALLVVTECDDCDGGYWPKRAPMSNSQTEQVFSRDSDCPSCGGKGYTYAAATGKYGGVMGYLDMPPLMEVSPNALVAVVELPKENPWQTLQVEEV